MVIKQNLNTLLNDMKEKKQYTILPYSKLTYSILLLLKRYCIKSIYLIGNWMLIYFLFEKKLRIKTFNLKDKRNTLSYEELREKKYKYGIIFSPRGVSFIKDALEVKQGGVLFCLIYYF